MILDMFSFITKNVITTVFFLWLYCSNSSLPLEVGLFKPVLTSQKKFYFNIFKL